MNDNESKRRLTVLQLLPALHAGGVERGALEISRYLVQQGHRSLVMSSGGGMLAQLLAEGGEHIDWPVGKKSLRTLLLIPRLRRFLQQQQVDILHLRSRMPAWLGYLAWRSMPVQQRPRLVTTVHGPYTVNAYSAVMTKGERVVAVSSFIRNYLEQNYPRLDMKRVQIIHRGVDAIEFPRHFQPSAAWLTEWQQTYPALSNRLLITLPARITRWKGQQDFIQLIARLVKSNLPVHGLIIGNVDAKKTRFAQELQAQIATLGLINNISMIGHRNDLKEIMSISSLVLSLSEKPEAFGRTIPEALSLGIPAIGYDHGGTGEILRQWYPQGLTPVGDINALEACVRALLNQPPPVPAQTDFSLLGMQQQTLAVYQDLVQTA